MAKQEEQYRDPEQLKIIRKVEKVFGLKIEDTALSDWQISENQVSWNEEGLAIYLSIQGSSAAGDFSYFNHLRTLKRLSISLTPLKDLACISQLKDLEELHLVCTEINDISNIYLFRQMELLNLHGNSISDLDPLKSLHGLDTLYLSSNEITDVLPLNGLESLRYLNIDDNSIEILSPLSSLEALEFLKVSKNRITDLHPIESLKMLRFLSLEDNQISELKPLSSLSRLTELNLTENIVSDLEPLSTVSGLRRLSIANNNISNLQPLESLSRLQKIDVGNNKIQSISKKMTGMLDIHWIDDYFSNGLNLYGNPLESPPIEVVKQGKEAVLNYFKSLEDSDTEVPLYESKLLVVGQGEVGKTWLLNRLLTGETPDTDTTEGIDIREWTIERNDNPTIDVNCWDFGGQAIYHSTHQFFLSKRSVYLFLWHARTDADLVHFDYWLSTIRMLGGDSPVLVVQTQCDSRIKPINESFWQEKFPNIKGFYNVSAQTGMGCDDLKTAIVKQIESLDHLGTPLPEKWVALRKQLEILPDDCISYSRYLEMAEGEKLDSEKAGFLSDFLHDLGTFLRFRASPQLAQTVFLQPEWATNAVYKVLDDKPVVQQSGRFAARDLERIWSGDSTYPLDLHPALLQLMQQFELCFKLPDGENYLIPELLPAQAPDRLAWNNSDNLIFRYKYDFMPAGLLPRLIVDLHQLIVDENFWKDGVVLRWDDTEALVRKIDLRVIELRVRGRDMPGMLYLLRSTFHRLHEPFDLEVSELIPCNCEVCQQSEEPYFYEYERLKKRLEKGKSSIECGKSEEDVEILPLLGRVEVVPPSQTKLEHMDKPEEKEFSLFIASGEELKHERTAIELELLRWNHHKEFPVKINPVMWESQYQGLDQKRVQDRFNNALEGCDVVVFLFQTRVGQFSQEEFDLAIERFRDGKKPKDILVFFKDEAMKPSELGSGFQTILDMRKWLKDNQQYGLDFDSNESLIQQLRENLRHIIS